MSANLNLVDLLKRKMPNPFGEVGEHPPLGPQPPRPNGVPANAHWDATGASPDGGEWIAPAISSPAIQRTALGVPNGDVVSLLKQGKNPAIPQAQKREINPVEIEPSAIGQSSPQPPVEIGQNTKGMSDVERQQALISMLRHSDPTSKVKQVGDVIEEGPPEQSPSRGKNFLLGLLRGVAQGGIGGGIGGGLRGLIDPKGEEQSRRDQQIAREEGKLGRQLGIEDKRADIDYRRAQPELLKQKAQDEADYRKESIRIRDAEEAGRISREKAEELQKDLDRKSREKISADDNASREKIAGMPSRADTSKVAESKAKRAAKLKEADDFIEFAKISEHNAEEAEKTLPDAFKEDVAGIQAKISSYREDAQQNRIAARKARTEAESIPEESSGPSRGKTAPSTHGFSISAWLKTNPGKTEADAKAEHDSKYKDYLLVP